MTTAVDLFAGPGGWDVAAHRLGIDVIGLEWDAAACATRAAAGFPTIRTDVAAYPAERFAGADGIIASPPCQTFSMAGGGGGRGSIADLADAMGHMLDGDTDPRPAIRDGIYERLIGPALAKNAAAAKPKNRATVEANTRQTAYNAALVLEPARWVRAIRPRWVALEQVPTVLPLWERLGEHLRHHGYRVWTGNLNAADYGVPQTRTRAILIASLDAHVGRPDPTHAKGGAVDLFAERLPWVSMAEALGWGMTARPYPTIACSSTTGGPDKEKVGGTRVRDLLYREQAEGPWKLNTGRDWQKGGDRDDAQTRELDQPAPSVATVASQWQIRASGGGTRRDTVRTLDAPAPTIATGHDHAAWAFERPATTVAGDPRVQPPGHKVNADDRRRLGDEEADARYDGRAEVNAIRVTAADAAILQSFPPDHPWQGNRTKQFEQIGNAVPPLLAEHVLREARR